ncbi:hypothetical protein MHLP_01705 [Candidatus Mycoplasma haematolamae str. Purdue]|uniref:Uncharacterized protein n=1 Tax=Mycoplasma haematolamae (strain Purdue) TaxID=1212765 RepID=I7CFA3_MYCHA|nr:hypothetical protein [Candidatus Mycoplasma haematolamae]AFO51921.1 hypothetical protein MHLP_01705 [Candidatus Mycoplasma haematolamae str. Purdue]
MGVAGVVGVGKTFLPQVLGYIHSVQAQIDSSNPKETKGITIPDWLFNKYRETKGKKVALKKEPEDSEPINCLKIEESETQPKSEGEVQWILGSSLASWNDFSNWEECKSEKK